MSTKEKVIKEEEKKVIVEKYRGFDTVVKTQFEKGFPAKEKDRIEFFKALYIKLKEEGKILLESKDGPERATVRRIDAFMKAYLKNNPEMEFKSIKGNMLIAAPKK